MSSERRIVAIETSGRQGSVAVGVGGGEVRAVERLPENNRHAIELMPAMERLVRGQGWKPLEVERIYLSIGPGSFTGLRIAVAMARAMAHASGGGMKLVGVPSLDVIAENAPGAFGYVVPILDAKRGQVFAARYRRGEGGGSWCG